MPSDEKTGRRDAFGDLVVNMIERLKAAERMVAQSEGLVADPELEIDFTEANGDSWTVTMRKTGSQEGRNAPNTVEEAPSHG